MDYCGILWLYKGARGAKSSSWGNSQAYDDIILLILNPKTQVSVNELMALFSPNAALVFNTIKVLFGSNPNIPISLISYLGFQLENLKGMLGCNVGEDSLQCGN